MSVEHFSENHSVLALTKQLTVRGLTIGRTVVNQELLVVWLRPILHQSLKTMVGHLAAIVFLLLLSVEELGGVLKRCEVFVVVPDSFVAWLNGGQIVKSRRGHTPDVLEDVMGRLLRWYRFL